MLVNSVSVDKNKSVTTFQARNAEIRYADDIVRRINNQFPRISLSRVDDFIKSRPQKVTQGQRDFLKNKSDLWRNVRNARPQYDKNPIGYIKHVVASVFNLKLGSCGESGSLGKLGLAVNNIEGTRVTLKGFNGPKCKTDMNHCIVIVKMAKDAKLHDYRTFGDKAYVVDPWMGFVDYVPNAFKRYEAAYSDDFKMGVIDTLGVDINDFQIDNNTKELVLKNFPDLKIPDKVK